MAALCQGWPAVRRVVRVQHFESWPPSARGWATQTPSFFFTLEGLSPARVLQSASSFAASTQKSQFSSSATSIRRPSAEVVRAMATAADGESAPPRQPFAVLYSYVEGMLEKRAPHRQAHLALCQQLQAEGMMMLGGALGRVPKQGLLVVLAKDETEVVDRFVRKDPYVLNGLVTEHQVLPWNVVIGTLPGLGDNQTTSA